MTLKGVMAILCVTSATSVAFSTHCVKVVEDIPKLSATEI